MNNNNTPTLDPGKPEVKIHVLMMKQEAKKDLKLKAPDKSHSPEEELQRESQVSTELFEAIAANLSQYFSRTSSKMVTESRRPIQPRANLNA